jgi:molybdate transport system permease protein
LIELSPEEWTAIRLSLRIAMTATLASLPLGILCAYALARWRFPGKVLLDGLIHLPLVLPPVVTGYMLLVLFGRRGALGAPLADYLGVILSFRWTGAALACAVMGFPLMVRPIRLSIEAIDRRLEDAAGTLGASGPWTFALVTLPLAVPGLVVGLILCFAKALGEFGATITFVSNIPGQTQTISAAIYTYTQAPGGDAADLSGRARGDLAPYRPSSVAGRLAFSSAPPLLARPLPHQCRHPSGGEDRISVLHRSRRRVVIGETAEIGDDVTLYHGVTLGGTSWSPGKRHPTLEDGVVVGAGAKILGPITVGRGTRVGANSVVIEGTPPDVTVVGIPAKVVRPESTRRRLAGRIDLDHHLMPDPVGQAIAVVLDRVEFLEARLAHVQKRLRLEGRMGRDDEDAATLDPAGAPRI